MLTKRSEEIDTKSQGEKKQKPGYNSFYQVVIKRFFDIVIGLCILPFALIVIIPIAIAIKIDDRGPVFYGSRRIGKDLKEFKMLKLRSMKVNAPMIVNSDGSTYNAPNDDRVTRVGKFIRETSLDEIPQIFNVLKGDMSFIGPRASTPFDDGSNDFLPDEIDKVKVRPGITGHTQAYYRNSICNRDKRVLDAWYANNVTFILDIKIFFKTISTVLKRENLYTSADKSSADENKQNINEKIDENILR